jgi:hypothetical protein
LTDHGGVSGPGEPVLEDTHPAVYYRMTAELLHAGRKDEAVFWYFLGQLRYRAHLAAHPDLEPSGDPALFASFSEVIGRPVNEYGFGDMPALLMILDAVLAWDDTHPNRFTPKDQFAAAHAGARAGLKALQDHIRENAADIRAKRAANRLENRR